MDLKSLRARIILSTLFIVTAFLAAITVLLTNRIETMVLSNIEVNARNMLEATRNHVESQHNSIQLLRENTYRTRKEELKNTTQLVFHFVNSTYKEFREGRLSRKAAENRIKKHLKNIRYADNVGYFWINDTDLPFPRMVMHPLQPELNGKILDDPKFNCAKGDEKNLFKAFDRVCKEKGEGFVEYRWPKPTKRGISPDHPKLSYVKLFRPFNWIIGTGLYIDDLDREIERRLQNIIKKLNTTIFRQKIGKSGYFFIFNEKDVILVHPALAGQSTGTIDRNSNANAVKLSRRLKAAALTPEKSINYLWNKPGVDSRYIYNKKAYVTYYEPLKWYICSTMYKEDIDEDVSSIIYRILLFSMTFLVIILIFSFFVSRSITTPLNRLTEILSNAHKQGIPVKSVPEEGTTETRLLGSTMNRMLTSLAASRKEIRSQRDFSMNIIDGSPNIICGITPNGITTFINEAGTKVTGYSKDEIIGRNWWSTLCPESDCHQIKKLLEISNEEDVIDYESDIECKDGSRKSIVWSSLTRSEARGINMEIIWFGHDITTRKRAEDALMTSENRYRTLFEKSADSILIIKDNMFIDCNQATVDMLRYENKEELLNTHPSELSPPAQPDGRASFEKADEMIATAYREGSHRFEWDHKKYDGEVFPVEVLLTVMPEGAEQLLHVVWRDISKRKRAEHEILESEERYRTLVEHAPEAIVVTDVDRQVFVDVNDNAVKLFGLPREDLLCLNPVKLSAPVQINNIPSITLEGKYIQLALDGKAPVFEWIHLNMKTGAEIPCEVRLVKIPSSKATLVRGSIIDITERKKAEEDIKLWSEELNKINDELTKHKYHLEDLVNERTDELRRSLADLKYTQKQLVESEKMASLGGLVAGVAHEINTPIGIGVTTASHLQDKAREFSGLYESGELSRGAFEQFISTAVESSGMILANMQRAADLIHSFKQVAVDQSSEERRTFKIREYIDEVLLSLKSKFKHTEYTISVDCPEEVVLNSFPGAISQILTNLIINSLKHGFEDSKTGNITIEVVNISDTLIMNYQDTGKGIPKKILNKIFDPFFTTRRGQGGSGLGLHIVYNLVTQTLGGTILVDSQEGEGTNFIIQLPITEEGQVSEV